MHSPYWLSLAHVLFARADCGVWYAGEAKSFLVSVQFVPQSYQPARKRKFSRRSRKPTWLMLCSWENNPSEYFLVPMSSPRRIIDELLASHAGKLIIWKSVSLYPDISPSIDSLKMLPAKDQEMVDSMKRRYAKRVIWKQLEDNGIQ